MGWTEGTKQREEGKLKGGVPLEAELTALIKSGVCKRSNGIQTRPRNKLEVSHSLDLYCPT